MGPTWALHGPGRLFAYCELLHSEAAAGRGLVHGWQRVATRRWGRIRCAPPSPRLLSRLYDQAAAAPECRSVPLQPPLGIKEGLQPGIVRHNLILKWTLRTAPDTYAFEITPAQRNVPTEFIAIHFLPPECRPLVMGPGGTRTRTLRARPVVSAEPPFLSGRVYVPPPAPRCQHLWPLLLLRYDDLADLEGRILRFTGL